MKTSLKPFILLILIHSVFSELYTQISMGLTSSYSIPLSQPVTRVYGSNEGYITYELSYLDQKKCFSYGAVFQVNFKKISLLTEALYQCTHTQFMIKDFARNEGQSMYVNEKTHNLKFPIAGTVNFKAFHIGAGPIFTYNLESDDLVKAYSEFTDKNLKVKPSFQFLIGTGWKRHLMLNLKYEYGLTKVGDDYYYNYSRSKLDRNINYFTVSLNVFP